MEHLNNLIGELLRSQVVVSSVTAVVLGVTSYLTVRLNNMSKQIELDQQAQTDMAESTKRGTLRSEYLAIYNSPTFTLEQKYGMTREIMKEYERLNGNHYLHSLDEALKEKIDKERGDDPLSESRVELEHIEESEV